MVNAVLARCDGHSARVANRYVAWIVDVRPRGRLLSRGDAAIHRLRAVGFSYGNERSSRRAPGLAAVGALRSRARVRPAPRFVRATGAAVADPPDRVLPPRLSRAAHR